jgi:hypothetical protein
MKTKWNPYEEMNTAQINIKREYEDIFILEILLSKFDLR